MSEFENKNEDIVQQPTNETPFVSADIANADIPALESTFRALEKIANENFNEITPEINTAQNNEGLNDNVQDNITSCVEPIEENFELTEAEIKHFTRHPDFENMDSQESTKHEETDIAGQQNIAMLDERPKEDTSSNDDLNLNATNLLTKTHLDDNSPLPEENILLTGENDLLLEQKSPLPELNSPLLRENVAMMVENNALPEDNRFIPNDNTSFLEKDNPSLKLDTVSNDNSLISEEKSPFLDELGALQTENSPLPEENSTSLHGENSFLPEENNSLPQKICPTQEEHNTLIEEDSLLQEENNTLPEEDSLLQGENNSLPGKTIPLLEANTPQSEANNILPVISSKPLEENKPPPEKSSLPLEPNNVPPEGSSIPSEESSLQPEESSLPLEESIIPPEETSLPPEESSLPPEESSLPLEESIIPPEESSLPPEENSLPLEESTLPPEESSLPPEESSLPPEENSLPPEESTLPPEESGLPLEECGLPPDENILSPEKNAAMEDLNNPLSEKDITSPIKPNGGTGICFAQQAIQKTLENVNDTSCENKDETTAIVEAQSESPNITKPVEDHLTKIQCAIENESILPTSTSMECDDIVVADENNEAAANEPVEKMDTCDSQESINLVIDEETLIVTENKDDAVIKTDNDTQSQVDPNEATSEIEGKNEENIRSQAENCLELTKDEIESKIDVALKKSDDISILNKSKDDDVIPIEQPPVPIIEIDDEEEMEACSNANEHKTNDETSTNNTDEKIKKSLDAKKENSTEKSSNETKSNSDHISENKDKCEEVLLEKSSEKYLDDDMQSGEPTKPISDDIEETNDEVFYNKECINYECPHKHRQYFKVPQFAFSYFKVTKKKFKIQYICADCYDKALEMYEEFCGLMSAKYPLLLESIPSGRQEFVEIIDSSDDEDSNSNHAKPIEPTKAEFSKNDLALIGSELNDTIKMVLNRIQIQNQLTWSKTILTERLKRLEMETEYVDNELRALQRKADKMHEGLYSCPKIKIRQLQPLDLNSGKLMSLDSGTPKEVQAIPPVGEIERPPIQQNSIHYAVKNNPIASWVPCKVMEIVEGSSIAQPSPHNVKHYKIKFIRSLTQMPKTVPAKYLAYYDPPAVRLPIGTRVIAYFDATSLVRGREKINVQSAFYPGIIAEPLKPNNKFRYLIFYDDGYTQYVYHKDVRLVCHVSECVWEDVHPASRDFIQKYLTQYSINRPMVQTQKGQSMNTESNGYWLHARVVDIDCSLVLMQFEGSKSHTEWIYRGSLRLGPVFKEYQKSLQKNSTLPVSRLSRRTEPFIRYTEDEENTSQQQQTEKSVDANRAVARKTFGRPESMMNSSQSTSNQQQQPTVKHLNNSTIYVEDENKPKGKVVYYTAKRNLPPRKYKPHKCSPSCQFEITHNLSAYSPLSKPLLSGWERFIIRQKIKRVVTYRAPCGKIIRNMKELHHYLRATNNVLNVDNFDFSHEISCLAEYVIESAIIQKRDISGGQEKMAIPLVNYYDNTLPPECKYSAKVIPTEGVNINTDPAFLVGCDCDDDCADKTKCACWQLTLAGAKYGNPNAAPEEVGYQYRRLLDHVPTGIYECNANCKCRSSCLNRVVQNSLTMKLQVFKTSNRGWGLRCINDIPRGSFVCVYAGHLLTEAKANEGGQDAGDEYFAELDYIEVAEQIKEGYESDVEPPEAEEEDAYNPEVDDDFTPSKSFLTRSKLKQNAIKSTRSTNQEEDSQERQVINFNPNADMNEDSVRESSIRKLYGKDEACYVMDAKISGNLGRYFNHSCAPNMFVQNVFVNTHDLRFPNVAFFSSCNIRAGTELTWNYNYEVGVVPGKVLYCQCGASNCRLRLL